METERRHEAEAKRLIEAIRKLASSEEASDNFESYLSAHFGAWLEKWANTPEGMAEEFESFANMYE